MTEAENAKEEQLGLDSVQEMLSKRHGAPAPDLLDAIDEHVNAFVGDAPLNDDLTMFVITRS